jgi:hypothetical protein
MRDSTESIPAQLPVSSEAQSATFWRQFDEEIVNKVLTACGPLVFPIQRAQRNQVDRRVVGSKDKYR